MNTTFAGPEQRWRSRKIHLVGLRPAALEAMISLHRASEPRIHELVDDPAVADMIVFVGSVPLGGQGVVDSPLPKLYPEKCFMYWDDDAVVPLLPGIYTNAVTSDWFGLQRTASHMFIDALNPHVAPMPNVEKKYLFSFAGGSTSLVRKKLYNLDFKRPDILIRNTSEYGHWNPEQEDRDGHQRNYAEIIAASHFGLCPRGASAGSLRLFEVMQMGVAPVLISDRFMLPAGPDWNKFLIRVPERNLKQLNEVLELHLNEAPERGRLARQAWEQWFAPPVMFNGIVQTFETMQRQRKIPERWMHLFWPYFLWRRRFYSSVRDTARSVVLGLFRLLRLKFVYQMNR